jgi:hypothetical protein
MARNVAANRHNRLRFRLNFHGREWTEGSGLKDTPKNRTRAEARAVLISVQGQIGYGRTRRLAFAPATVELISSSVIGYGLVKTANGGWLSLSDSPSSC